jgi:predicted O-methyltransferase YrrM
MHHTVATILDEMCAYGRAHDAATPDRLDRLRNLDPASGAVLAQLARVAAAKHILEIGTSNGYSTLWLADAAADTSGVVLSIDIDSRRSQMAADNLARAGLGRHVELRVQDAANWPIAPTT